MYNQDIKETILKIDEQVNDLIGLLVDLDTAFSEQVKEVRTVTKAISNIADECIDMHTLLHMLKLELYDRMEKDEE